jgi:hypothetical protein
LIRPDLPLLPLAELPGGPEPVVLCATARLALDLRRAHGDLQAARGALTWQALQSSTPALWLDSLVSRALLSGEIPPEAAAGGFLGHVQERNLWEQAIARDTGAAADLFDREGMALAAMEAASLQRSWRIEVPDALHNAEYTAFLRWREDVDAASRDGDWRGMDAILAWRIACVERGIGGLPVRVGFAGFILPDPTISFASISVAAATWRRAASNVPTRRRNAGPPRTGRASARRRAASVACACASRWPSCQPAAGHSMRRWPWPCMATPSAPAGPHRNAITRLSAANRWLRSPWSTPRCPCCRSTPARAASRKPISAPCSARRAGRRMSMRPTPVPA